MAAAQKHHRLRARWAAWDSLHPEPMRDGRRAVRGGG